MAYSGEDLFKNYRKTYVISPFRASQVSPLGYDLRIGHAVSLHYTSPDAKGSVQAQMEVPSEFHAAHVTHLPAQPLLKELTIAPGQSFLVVTVEQICLGSKVLATVQAKASLSIQGLFLNPVTVDPNFASDEGASGRLVLFLHNASGRKVKIKEKDGIATLIMHEVSTETTHLPEKSGFSMLLDALEKNYDGSVIQSFSGYTKEYDNTRALSEFMRDRKALLNVRTPHRPHN